MSFSRSQYPETADFILAMRAEFGEVKIDEFIAAWPWPRTKDVARES